MFSCNIKTLKSHYYLIQIVSIFGISNSGLIGRKHLTLMYLIALLICNREGIDEWLMIDWWSIDDWWMINGWLNNDWLMNDWWLIDDWKILDCLPATLWNFMKVGPWSSDLDHCWIKGWIGGQYLSIFLCSWYNHLKLFDLPCISSGVFYWFFQTYSSLF